VYIIFFHLLAITEKPPEYTFTQKLKPKSGIQRKKEGMLECFVSDTKAKVKWFKNGQPVEVSVKTIIKYTILVKIHNTT